MHESKPPATRLRHCFLPDKTMCIYLMLQRANQLDISFLFLEFSWFSHLPILFPLEISLWNADIGMNNHIC